MELVMDLATEDHFRLDFVMTNQSYVHEWGNLGWIYLQVFPHMKMYAGQSINIVDRFKKYKSFCGSNPHHSNALKKYGWETIQKIVVEVPKFLMNRIECFLIEWYDLTNTSKGYNKTTGGRIGYHMSLATRKKMSQSKLGDNHHMYGKTLSDVTKKNS